MRANAEPNTLPQHTLRVLVVESTRMGSQLIADSLKRCRQRFDVQAIAIDSLNALRELETYKPNVAIISAELPDGRLTGFKVLHQLRAAASDVAAVMLLSSNE